MGLVETETRKKRHYGYIKLGLLTAVAATGAVLVATTAPGLPGALDKLPSVRRARLKYQYKSAFKRLVAQGHIVFEKRDGKSYARITKAGRKILAFEQQKAKLKMAKKSRWNGRWRVIVFDIPERRRKTRDRLRQVMQGTGFMRLQDSVWVFP